MLKDYSDVSCGKNNTVRGSKSPGGARSDAENSKARETKQKTSMLQQAQRDVALVAKSVSQLRDGEPYGRDVEPVNRFGSLPFLGTVTLMADGARRVVASSGQILGRGCFSTVHVRVEQSPSGWERLAAAVRYTRLKNGMAFWTVVPFSITDCGQGEPPQVEGGAVVISTGLKAQVLKEGSSDQFATEDCQAVVAAWLYLHPDEAGRSTHVNRAEV